MEYFNKIVEWFNSTHIHEQILEVDYIGLFSNPWFLVPFVSLVLYMLFKQQWRDLTIIILCIAIWWVTGTEYMNSLLVNGEIQIEKVLPVIFGGAVAVGFVIYLLFGRSD